jgi:hypothetical protein
MDNLVLRELFGMAKLAILKETLQYNISTLVILMYLYLPIFRNVPT